MNIIIDSNVIMSALIKDSITRKIIKESNLEGYELEAEVKEGEIKLKKKTKNEDKRPAK